MKLKTNWGYQQNSRAHSCPLRWGSSPPPRWVFGDDFQVYICHHPGRHDIPMPFNSIYGIKKYNFQPWLALVQILAGQQQSVFQNNKFPKWKMKGFCSWKLDFYRLVKSHRVCWEGRKGLVLANTSGLWAHSYDLNVRIWFGLARRGRFMAFVGDKLSRQIWKPFWISNKQMMNIACFIF